MTSKNIYSLDQKVVTLLFFKTALQFLLFFIKGKYDIKNIIGLNLPSLCFSII